MTWSILSLSLLTVMAGAAIAPALGIIKNHFSAAPTWQVQFIISLPALFIIFTNLLFPLLCRRLKSKTIALTGLILYVICGSIPFFIDNIALILVFRALLGVSVGIIMPLSTGLLSFYFSPEKQGSLMGLSAAMNQLGGVVATLLAGVLANISWNCAFLVYLLGLIAVVMVSFFIPNEHIATSGNSQAPGLISRLKQFHPSVIGMFLCMTLFFVYPSNFAIITSHQQSTISNNTITIIMVALDVVAFATGLAFSRLMRSCRRSMKYFAPAAFILGYLILASFEAMWSLLAGSFFIGIANGVGVPYLNTIASIKGGKDAATTVMPLISASLYAGQFLSPLIFGSLGNVLLPGLLTAPYILAVAGGVIYLVQAFCTRNIQALPPAEK